MEFQFIYFYWKNHWVAMPHFMGVVCLSTKPQVGRLRPLKGLGPTACPRSLNRLVSPFNAHVPRRRSHQLQHSLLGLGFRFGLGWCRPKVGSLGSCWPINLGSHRPASFTYGPGLFFSSLGFWKAQYNFLTFFKIVVMI